VSGRVDKRRIAIPLAVSLVGLGGWLLQGSVTGESDRPRSEDLPGVHIMLDDEDAQRAHQSFQQAVAMLQAGEFDYAVTALHNVLAIYPTLPEAHVNMGFALLGLDNPEAAADFFDTASTLRPSLHNAYYGLGLAERENGNDKAALAAMQAYAHLAAENDRHLPQAQEIIWELQAETGGASQ